MSAAENLMPDAAHRDRMDRMYRYQRHIYDATRKYYLFGRDTLIRELAVERSARVLEIGCGTGRNLALIGRRYPQARLFGLDISAEMLASAERTLARQGTDTAVLRVADATHFHPRDFGEDGFERIVISYALSMIPEWEKAIDAALDALSPGGSLHIVDFGQQERLPPLARRVLLAWLARFHVTPRARLVEIARTASKTRGISVDSRAIGRGYAWLLTCSRL